MPPESVENVDGRSWRPNSINVFAPLQEDIDAGQPNSPQRVESNQMTDNILSQQPIQNNTSSRPHPDAYTMPDRLDLFRLYWFWYRYCTWSCILATLAMLINISVFLMFRQAMASLPHILLAAIINLTISLLVRQDFIVNSLFFRYLSPTWPPFWKRNADIIFSYGGVHIGCVVSLFFWQLWFLIAGTWEHQLSNEMLMHLVTLGIPLAMFYTAYDRDARHKHDTFETVHRYGSLVLLLLLWSQHLATNGWILTSFCGGLTSGLLTTTTCLILRTGLGFLPPLTRGSWLEGFRRVNVNCRILDPGRLLLMHFPDHQCLDYTTIRLSKGPWSEWHGFATITKSTEDGFSVLISDAGDWTQDIINTPPRHIWVKGIPAYGVLGTAKFFERIVLAATGSGIGPCLPIIYNRPENLRIFWSTRNLESYGVEIKQAIIDADPRAHIHDTATMGGRPTSHETAKLLYRLFFESNAEAIYFVSGKEATQDIVYELRSRGIPAFGSIFDA
jgi:hypothetical protein